MQILSVTLKNFKSHHDRHFVFQVGTNAICGENGAGKTSILEAIAWVLFDYSGDYTKEDLIYNGAGSAQVRVAFVSNRDGRTYDVQRCTTKGYTLYDPQLNQRLPYSRIKEEVLPWLRQHLGVAPTTDLGQLFSSTIGVPQGTFTADFLLTRERRKPIFDKILKLEEYQQTWKKLGELEKFSKLQVGDLERDIDRTEADLQRLMEIQAKRDQQHQAIVQAEAELKQTQQQVEQLEQQVEQLEQQENRLQQLDQQLAQLDQLIATQLKTLTRSQEDLQQAEKAAEICTTHRQAYQSFLQVEEKLRQLEQQRRMEQSLQHQKRQQEKQLSDRQTELARVTLQLNRLQEVRQDMQRLEPLAQHQRDLEQQQQSVSQHLQRCYSLHQTIQEQEKRLAQLQTRQTQLKQDITTIQSLATIVQEIPNLEQHQQRLQQQLSRIAAASEFAADLQHLYDRTQRTNQDFAHQVQQATVLLHELQQAAPLWQQAIDQVLTTLNAGATSHDHLTTSLQQLLTDLVHQTAPTTLEQHLQTITLQLQTARQHQVKFTNLERLLADYTQLETENVELQTRIVQLNGQLSEEENLQRQYAHLAEQLTDLQNPIGKIQLYQQELQQETSLYIKMVAIQQATQEIAPTIAQLEEQLAAFVQMDAEMTSQQTLRDQYRQAYEIYMRHREVANTRKQRAHLVQETTTELEQAQHQHQTLTEERDRLCQMFDSEQFQILKKEYQSAKDQHHTLKVQLPLLRQFLAASDRDLVGLAALQANYQAMQSQLDQKKKTDRFIKFARKAYKEAAPRITECYIQQINQAADRLFRELLNRPNVSLQWTRDYDIVVREGSHPRRFTNLSGGEQMCAALAVRLALLKVLADIDVAFFDEPTTNMDRPRREHLADAIANIKTFRQLFVISHDDTFEKITENIILVERNS